MLNRNKYIEKRILYIMNRGNENNKNNKRNKQDTQNTQDTQNKKGKELWMDRGRYLEHWAEQGSEEWKKARVGRITASVAGTLAGLNVFKSVESVAETILGKEDVIPESNREDIERGQKCEAPTRKWIEKKYNYEIIERGLCVYKENKIIASSVDGDIVGEDCIIEIKHPRKMYRGLSDYMNAVNNGWQAPKDYYEHVLPTHFAQMQQGCFVLGRKWCLYVVRDIYEGKIFTQRIPFMSQYWDNFYKKILHNYSIHVEPLLIKNKSEQNEQNEQENEQKETTKENKNKE